VTHAGKANGWQVGCKPAALRRVGSSILSACTIIVVLAGCTPLHVDWPAVVACAGPIGQGLVAAVEAILKQDGSASELGPDALAALESLASQYGASTIVCVIESLIDSWLPSTGMAASPDQAQAARRAQAFLNDKGVTVTQ
jgi:hypothetical protein